MAPSCVVVTPPTCKRSSSSDSDSDSDSDHTHHDHTTHDNDRQTTNGRINVTETPTATDTDALVPKSRQCHKCRDQREYVQLASMLGCVQLCCVEVSGLDSTVLHDGNVCLCPKQLAALCRQQKTATSSTQQTTSHLYRHTRSFVLWLAAASAAACALWLWWQYTALLPHTPPRSKELVVAPTGSTNMTVTTSSDAASQRSIPLTAELLAHFHPSVLLHSDAETERAMDIYCRGPILHAVQMARVFSDSKHFVDMPIKANSSAFDIIVDFERRRLATTEFRQQSRNATHATQLRHFLTDHFDPPGSELIPITPFDYQELTVPSQIARIQNATLRGWAFQLHQLWRTLGRVPNGHVRSSYLHAKRLADPVLHRPQNVLIVPGGRFRESYYWDSYWIVEGLLVSDMQHTARGVVNNLLEYVAEFGFVPNGGRIYYLTRSQPPMLSDMVKLVAQTRSSNDAPVQTLTTNKTKTTTPTQTFDVAYLNATLPILEREYAFWMQLGPCGHAIEILRPAAAAGNGQSTVTHILNRFTSSANHPRPESYREDVNVAAEIYSDALSTSLDGTTHWSEAKQSMYYNDIIAAAESGWDFSSRWLRDNFDLKTVATSRVVPVDLNAIMHRFEQNMASFYRIVGNTERAAYFDAAATKRVAAIDAVLWNQTVNTWKDYNLDTETHATIASVSDYTPLWASAFNVSDTVRLNNVVASLEHSGLLLQGGIQTTTVHTGQQWDAPNAWAPSQDMVLQGLLQVKAPEARRLARRVLQRWVNASLVAYRKTGLMFEKYNATEVGGLGVGGEYFPQFGFGWTNGVILKFLAQHQDLLVENEKE